MSLESDFGSQSTEQDTANATTETAGLGPDSDFGNNAEESGNVPFKEQIKPPKDPTYDWFKATYEKDGAYLDVDLTSDPIFTEKGVDETKLSTYQQKLLTTRYGLWRGGASRAAFSEKEIAEFNDRDELQGVSDQRLKRDAEEAINSPTYVKFDPESGRPIGVFKKDPQGNETLVKSYDEFNEMLNGILGTEFEGFGDWQTRTGNQLTDVRGTEEYGGLTDLINQMQSGVIPDDVYQRIAESLGYGSIDEVTGELRAREDELQQGIGAQQGLSDEERANMERSSRESIRAAETEARRALESIRASGQSAAKYFMMSDEFISKITNQRVQSELMIANEDWRRKSEETALAERRLDALRSAGQITESQQLTFLQSNRASAIEGYAEQIDAILAENQELFQEYSTDQQAIAANLQNMYAGLQAAMGLDQFALAEAETMYNNQLAPFLYQLDILTQEQMIAMQNEAMDIQKEANVMGLVGDIIGGIGTIFGGGVGGAIADAIL